MELIDTHCHLTFAELENDIDSVIARSKSDGVVGWITVGTDPDQNQKVVALVPHYENMYAALGVHPHYAKDVCADDLAQLKDFAGGDKVVAIGETGLDYHYNFSAQARQKEIFAAQLEIAGQLDKPVIVHCRNAFDDCMGIVDDFTGRVKNVVVHCYSGDKGQARVILDRGFYISFTGIVTFKKTGDVRQAAAYIPLDRMMVETDCPYISPEPVRNTRPCEPAMMLHTARKLAEIKKMDIEDFSKATTTTSKKFFNLP